MMMMDLSDKNAIPWIRTHASCSSEFSESFSTVQSAVFSASLNRKTPPFWPMSHMYK